MHGLLIALEGQHVIRIPASTIAWAIFFWHPIASIEFTMQPLNSSTRSNSGTAVISAALVHHFNFAQHQPVAFSAHALTTYLTPWSPFKARRSALPAPARRPLAPSPAARTLHASSQRNIPKMLRFERGKSTVEGSRAEGKECHLRSSRHVWNQSLLGFAKITPCIIGHLCRFAQSAPPDGDHQNIPPDRMNNMLRLMQDQARGARCATCPDLLLSACFVATVGWRTYPSLFKHM